MTDDPASFDWQSWREGDEITPEHRRALADDFARTFNMTPKRAAAMREDFARKPAAKIAPMLAIVIAYRTKMDVLTFTRAFPTISRDESSAAVRFFYSHGGAEDEEVRRVRLFKRRHGLVDRTPGCSSRPRL